MKKFLFVALFTFVHFLVVAQDTAVNEARQGTGMRANEKVYVVAAVLATVLAGLIVYVIRLDKKISRLERNAP